MTVQNMDELVKYIDKTKMDFEESTKHLGIVRPEKIPTVYFRLGLYARAIALSYLKLGDKVDALEWCSKASELFIGKIESENLLYKGYSWLEYGRHQDALFMGIFSGNADLIKRCIQLSLNICGESPGNLDGHAPGYYSYVAFVRFLNGDTEKALDAIEKVNTTRSAKYADYFKGLKNSLQGLAWKDRQSIIDGLKLLLSFHNKMYARSKVPDEQISIPATVFIKIAIEKGLYIKPGDIDDKYQKYIPWNLFDQP